MYQTQQLSIRTAEGVSFSVPLAGPILRFFAWCIDFAVIGFILMLFSILSAVFALFSLELTGALFLLAYSTLTIGYGMAFEWFWRGQTVGKRVFGLRVMDAQGLRLHVSQVVIRNLLRAIDFLPMFYLVGVVALLLNARNQRLGDLAGNTVVVRRSRAEEPDFDQILPGKYNSFRGYPHLEARLRQRVSREEASIVLQALLRRDSLDPDQRVELYREFASHLREAVQFPEEAVAGLTDEQYLRNALETLYRG